MVRSLLLFWIASAVIFAAAPVKIVTTTTDLSWAAKEIGGDKVSVDSLLKGTENPHYIDAVPDYIRRVAESDVICLVGLDLEIGWIPKVLEKTGKRNVQSGGNGYCETGRAITVLEKPTTAVDRSMGDVHPVGNPHFWLSPTELGKASSVIAETLSSVDPDNQAYYQKQLKALVDKLGKLQSENAKLLSPILAKKSGPWVLEYHKEFTYFLSAYGIKSLGTLEEKPGIPPSAGRIAQVASQAKQAHVKFLLAGDTAPKSVLQKFEELSGIPVITAPVSIQKNGEINTYEKLQAHLIEKIVKNSQAAAKSDKTAL